MFFQRTILLFLFTCLGVIGCGGGGGSDPAPKGDSPGSPNLTLSLSAAAPGDFLAISHPQIAAGSELTVTFEESGVAKAADSSYVVSAKTVLTFAGSAMIAVPAYFDPATATVMSGDVTVRIAGINDSSELTINEPPELLDMAPGEATQMVVEFAIDEYSSALDKIDALPLSEQVPFANWIDSAENTLASLLDMSDELATQRLTITEGTSMVILEGAQLQMLDRLLAAHFSGIADAATVLAARAVYMSPFLTTPRDFKTRQGFADVLRNIKNVGIPGVQAASSYITVGVGTVSLIVAFVPGGQPLATAGAGFAMFTTLISTVGMATGGFFVDLSIDAVEGRDPDLHNALDGALVVVRDGVVSIALTAAGGVQWAGSTLSGIASVINDGVSGRDGLRDLQCGLSPQRSLAKATLGEFCTLTGATPPGGPVAGTFSAVVTIPGYSLSFNPSVSVAIPSVWVNLQSTIAIVATEGADANSEYISITLNPSVVTGPGTFTVASDAASSAALFLYGTPAIKHAGSGLPIDGTNIALSGFSGTITLTSLGLSEGEKLAGSFSIQIVGNQVTGVDQESNPTSVQHMGTASGSFSVSIQATSSVALP